MSKTNISSRKLLLVEGSHEISFFQRLNTTIVVEGVQILDVVGQSQFAPNILNLTTDPGFGAVESIGIVRDADDDFDAKLESLQAALRKAKLPVPKLPDLVATDGRIRISIFLLPNNQDTGCLEDLCLATVRDDAVMPCVNSYLDCVETTLNTKHPHYSKAKTQVFLASKNEGDVSMARASGLGYWNFNSPALDKVKSFVSLLVAPVVKT